MIFKDIDQSGAGVALNVLKLGRNFGVRCVFGARGKNQRPIGLGRGLCTLRSKYDWFTLA